MEFSLNGIYLFCVFKYNFAKLVKIDMIKFGAVKRTKSP